MALTRTKEEHEAKVSEIVSGSSPYQLRNLRSGLVPYELYDELTAQGYDCTRITTAIGAGARVGKFRDLAPVVFAKRVGVGVSVVSGKKLGKRLRKRRH